MKGIKMDKPGSDNTETLEMLTRNIDGETCLDVECGPNKAVLYLSKLIGGSKNECILHDMEWLTPNAFQKMSGRGSAKDWKRSIRHNGVSLKTFMLCGVLEMPADSKLRLKVGKGISKDSKLQNLKGIKETFSKTKVDTKEKFERNVDDDIGEIRQDDNTCKHVTDTRRGLDREQEINRQIESGSEDDDQNEKQLSDNVKEDEVEVKTFMESTGHRPVTTMESTKQSNKDQKFPEGLSVDPYEMTVTPPPTPPHHVYDGHIVPSKLNDTSDNDQTTPIKYKPYLLHSGVKHDELISKGNNHTISKEIRYSVASPGTETTNQRNSTPKTDDIHRHSVIVTYPNSSAINPRIPTDRHVFTHSAIQPYDHFQHSYNTSESKRHDGNINRLPKLETTEFSRTLQYSSEKYSHEINEISQHSGFKRQFDELEQDEPLDLSIKKKRNRDQDSASDQSRDNHVPFVSKSDLRLKNKTASPPMDIMSRLSQIPFPKLTHNHFHPLLHQTYPLQRLKYDHGVDKINPYLYGFYVNPLQN